MRCFDQHNQLGSGAQMNMDGLHLVSSPSIDAFRADPPKAQKGPQPDLLSTIKSRKTRNFPGSNVRYQSRNLASANKVTRSSEFSGYSSCHSFVTCSNSYDLIPKRCNAINSPNAFTDSSNVDKAVKKNSRKKTRRKGKQNKKISSDSGSTEPEVLSEYAHGSSTSDTCGYNNNGEELVSYAISPEASLPDGSINKIDFEGDTIGFNHSEAPETCTSNIDIVETTVSSMIGECQVINSEIGIRTKDEGFAVLDGGVAEKNPMQISCCDDIHSKSFSDMPDSIVLDSVSVGSNSDDSTDASHSIKSVDKESSRGSFSEAPVFRKGYFSHKNLLNGVVDKYDHTEGSKHSGQNCSCSDAQLLVAGKRGKQIKTLPRDCGVYKFGGVGNFHGRTGKENNHSVWQKVQKNGADDICELKKGPIFSEFDISLKEMPSFKRHCNVAEVNISSQTEDKKKPKDKVSKKLKRKNSLGSKQEYISYNGRGSHPNKASLNARAKSNMQQNKMLDMSGPVTKQKGVKSVARSHSQNGCPRTGFQNNRVESVDSESVRSLQAFPDVSEPLGGTCDAVSSVKNHHTEDEDSSLPKSYDSLDKNLLEVRPPVYLPHLLSNKVSQIENECTLAEYCKQNHGSGSVLQKWIPIGVKDPELITSARFGSSSLDPADGPTGEDWTLRSTDEEKVASDLFSSLILGMGQNSQSANCFFHKDDHIQKLSYSTAWMLEHSKNVAANCLISECKHKKFSAFEAESNKIEQAVNDVCRVQLASEAIQMATGGPIAEFERVLHLSSPVICHSPTLSCCKICSQDKVGGALLCKHKTPNISLGCLWQWYEKHGSYGLEVRAEDYESSKRFGVDCFSSRAYFVPFLSAVQLFKDRTSQPIKNNNGVPASGVLDTCDINETLENSDVGHLPMFSILVPQPRITNAAQSVDMTWSDDVELLFEYFESDQPQQRRPLYEK